MVSYDDVKTLAEGSIYFDCFIHEVENQAFDPNETSTRFHIIDNVLKSLGWNNRDFQLEKQENGEFTDYELGAPRRLIVEAKNSGISFQIPSECKRNNLRCIRSIMAISSEAKKAIMQVQRYCSDRGVKIAVVTNGYQFISFLATRDDGISPFDQKCLVYSSLEHLRANFSEAWQCLSPEGVADSNLQRKLCDSEIKIPKKLSSCLSYYPKHRNLSDIHSSLKTLADLLIQDVFETDSCEKDFIKHCYSESGALSKHSLLSKSILNARYNSIFNKDEPQVSMQDVRSEKKSSFDKNVLAEAMNKRPIVLLGDVGVGKTSFIKNLKHNSAYEEFSRAIFINIDLGYSATLTDDLYRYVLDDIKRQLFDVHSIDINSSEYIQGVYSREIQRFASSIYASLRDSNISKYEEEKIKMLELHINNEPEHIRRVISYASKKLKRQVIIAIDNADQRDIKTQQDAFLISQELSKKWDAIVFISVRPKTFFYSKKSGVLSAYPNKVFTIKPPKIEQVISKRLIYAINIAKGVVTPEEFSSFMFRSDNLVSFLTSLVFSLDQNDELKELITNITGGNVRQAIDVVTGFIGNPNVDVDRIIDETERRGPFYIQLHEFSKSILLGELFHYFDERSISMNVYDVEFPDYREHFLKSLIICYISCDDCSRDGDGFVQYENIEREMQNNGFRMEQVSRAVKKLINKKLIETNKRFTLEEDELHLINEQLSSVLIRNTSAGLYHVHRWAPTFVYLDAISHDTPIFDDSMFSSMRFEIESIKIQDRNNRTKTFKSYLLNMWKKSNIKTNYYDFEAQLLSGDDTFDFVEQACKQIERDHGSGK